MARWRPYDRADGSTVDKRPPIELAKECAAHLEGRVADLLTARPHGAPPWDRRNRVAHPDLARLQPLPPRPMPRSARAGGPARLAQGDGAIAAQMQWLVRDDPDALGRLQLARLVPLETEVTRRRPRWPHGAMDLHREARAVTLRAFLEVVLGSSRSLELPEPPQGRGDGPGAPR